MYKYAVLLGIFGLAFSAHASPGLTEENTPVAADGQAATQDSPTATSVNSETPLSRWLKIDALSFTMRYRNPFDTTGSRIFDDIQQRSLVSGKFKFDNGGKYFVGFRAESGRYFNWAFADFSGLDYAHAIAGTIPHLTPQHVFQFLTALRGDPQGAAVSRAEVARGWEFYIRDLYLSATPVKWLTV